MHTDNIIEAAKVAYRHWRVIRHLPGLSRKE
jgi:hypothetical protein